MQWCCFQICNVFNYKDYECCVRGNYKPTHHQSVKNGGWFAFLSSLVSTMMSQESTTNTNEHDLTRQKASDGIRNLCGRPVCYCTVEKMWLCLNIYHFPLTFQEQTQEAERAAGHHFLTLLWPAKLQYVTTAAPCRPPSTAPSLGAGVVVMETKDRSLMMFKSQTNDRPDSKINIVLWNWGSVYKCLYWRMD